MQRTPQTVTTRPDEMAMTHINNDRRASTASGHVEHDRTQIALESLMSRINWYTGNRLRLWGPEALRRWQEKNEMHSGILVNAFNLDFNSLYNIINNNAAESQIKTEALAVITQGTHEVAPPAYGAIITAQQNVRGLQFTDDDLLESEEELGEENDNNLRNDPIFNNPAVNQGHDIAQTRAAAAAAVATPARPIGVFSSRNHSQESLTWQTEFTDRMRIEATPARRRTREVRATSTSSSDS